MTPTRTAGSSPAGVLNERQAAAWVRSMFGTIAPRYDLLNRVLSFGIDRYWRFRAVQRLKPILRTSGVRVLDVCCGTGDLTSALRFSCAGAVIGSDFSGPMLRVARRKTSGSVPLLESDALGLPVRDQSLDLITVAFGFRNLANYDEGLAEMRRVLKPGGTLAILEFSQPPFAPFAALYRFYSHHLLPRIARLFTRHSAGYSYLPESVRRFPDAPELQAQMEAAGFGEVSFQRMTGGIVALHMGKRKRNFFGPE